MHPLVPLGGDPALLRSAFAQFPTGVVAVAAQTGSDRHVLVASSFQVGISADPPLVLFAVQHTSTTWPLLSQAPRLGVSVLSDAHGAVCRQLASKTVADRFAGVPTTTGEDGALFLDQATVALSCRIHARHAAGDHELVLLEVDAVGAAPEHAPLVWHGSSFRRLTALDAA